MNQENILKVIAMIELEDSLSEKLRDFDGDVRQITLTDVTRAIRKDAEVLAQIRHFIKLKNEKK